VSTQASIFLYLTSLYLPSSSKYKCNVYNKQLSAVWEAAATHEELPRVEEKEKNSVPMFTPVHMWGRKRLGMHYKQ